MDYKDHPYHDSFRRKLEEIRPGLSGDLSQAALLAEGDAQRLLRHVLELHCQCQNVGNILLGRGAAIELPRVWLLERIEAAAEAQLDLTDDYEYSNLMLLATMLDTGLVARLAARGLASESPWIIEIADYHARNREKPQDQGLW
jgi:hypothetical protein